MPCLKSLISNISSGATRSIRDFDLRLWACGICASEIYFLNFLENKGEKDWSDAQPDSAIQPKAGGLLHMEREYFAHHIWISGIKHLTASKQPEVLGGLLDVSEGRPEATRRMFWLLEVLEDAQPSTWCLQHSATKSSGACQT